MKENYEVAEMEAVHFEAEDIITASDGTGNNDEQLPPPPPRP